MVRTLRFVALVATGVVACSLSGASPRVLFPANLHLTREVRDPMTETAVRIEEYCSGNRIVSVSAEQTVIVDYGKQEITEIHRGRGTFSVSRFDEVAVAPGAAGPRPPGGNVGTDGDEASRWRGAPVASEGEKRLVETFEFTSEGSRAGLKVRVGVDRSVALTREAVEALVGAAYPNPARAEHEPILRAAREGARGEWAAMSDDVEPATGEARYGLPVTQSFTYADSGREVTFASSIVRVGTEVVPIEALLIPPGFLRVESTAAAVRRQLLDLDRLPSAAPQGQ